MSAKAGLQAAYDEQIARQDRLHELQRECLAAPARGQREQMELLDYERSLGEGAESDPKRAEKLTKAWQTARVGLEAKPVAVLKGDGNPDLIQEWVDPRLEARREGAEAALEAAREAVRLYINRNLEDLAAEDADEAAVLQREGKDALATLMNVLSRIEGKRGWWTGISTRGGLDYLLHEIPDNPLGRLLASSPLEVPLPLPECFVQ